MDNFDNLSVSDENLVIRWIVKGYGAILRDKVTNECQVWTARFNPGPDQRLVTIDGVDYTYVSRACAQDW